MTLSPKLSEADLPVPQALPPEKGKPYSDFPPFSCAPDEYKSEEKTKSEPREAGPIWERKKDSADVQFSRLFRKPRKRNGAEFF